MHLSVLFLQEFEFHDWDELCDKLNALATDCNKHRAKTDKRKQRSVFRDVLKAVEVSLLGFLRLHSQEVVTALLNPPPVCVLPGGGVPV